MIYDERRISEKIALAEGWRNQTDVALVGALPNSGRATATGRRTFACQAEQLRNYWIEASGMSEEEIRGLEAEFTEEILREERKQR